MLGRARRLAILAEGCFTPLDAKTAVGVIRYRGDQVAAVIDRTRAGRTAQSCAGVGGDIPVVADIAAAVAAGADSLLIGIGAAGRRAHRRVARRSSRRPWTAAGTCSPGSTCSSRTIRSSRRAHARGGRADPRRSPAAGRSRHRCGAGGDPRGADRAHRGHRLQRRQDDGGARDRARARGAWRRARASSPPARPGSSSPTTAFRSTRSPPTSSPARSSGPVIDTARGSEVDVVLVEGQGALHHPGYSGVTLALLHGAAPAAMVLCHDVARDRIRITGGPAEGLPIPSLAAAREAYEARRRGCVRRR